MEQQKQTPSFTRMLLLIVSLAAVGQMTNTIYVPAMDLIAQGLQVGVSQVQEVMAFYLVPYGLSQFLYGPLSDRFGRKPIILVGLIIFIAGSLLASLATSFTLLRLGSFIQGLGIGCGGVMARTVMRDLYHGKRLHKAASYVSIALIVAPLMAPLLGGILSAFWGWRAAFFFLTVFATLVLSCEFFLFPETNQRTQQGTFSLKSIQQNYQIIFKNPQFLGYMSCLVVTFSGVCIFEAVGGILFTHTLHFSTIETSLWFTVPLPAFMFGSYLSGYLTKRYPLNSILLFGIILLMTGGSSLLLTGLLRWINIYAIIIPISFYMLAAGILFPAATSGALEPFPHLAGTAGAVLGGMQNLGAGGAIIISATIPQTTQLPLGFILCAMGLGVAAIFYFCIWQQSGRSVYELN